MADENILSVPQQYTVHYTVKDIYGQHLPEIKIPLGWEVVDFRPVKHDDEAFLAGFNGGYVSCRVDSGYRTCKAPYIILRKKRYVVRELVHTKTTSMKDVYGVDEYEVPPGYIFKAFGPIKDWFNNPGLYAVALSMEVVKIKYFQPTEECRIILEQE